MALQKLSPQRLDTSTGIILTPANTPSGPIAGQIYYDSTDNQVQFYNGSAWGSMGGVEGIIDNSNATAITIGSDESVTLAGDLIVNGTTTTINTANLTVDDRNIELGSVTSPTDGTADGGGIILKGLTDKTILWDNTNDNWTSNQSWNLATGNVFKINNTTVLSATTLQYLDATSSIQTQIDSATLTSGIADTNNVIVNSASVADDEYARFTASGLESRSTSEVLSDIGAQASLTSGIADTNNVVVNSASVADDEYARFTASGLESRSTSEVLSDIGAAGTASPTFTGTVIAEDIDLSGALSGSFLQDTTTTIEGTISEQKLVMADTVTLTNNLTVNDRLVLTQMQDDKYGLDAHVKLLIHSDTTDTSTTFTDSSRLGTHTITANGNAQHKTAQYKFGATSIYVDSGSSYLTIPNHVDFNFGTTDFTIDFWVRADTSGADGGVISKYEIAGWIFDFGTGGSYGQMRFRDQSSGATNMYSTNALNDNQWYHVAVTRSSDVFRLFIDGVQNDSVTTSYDYAGSSMTEPLLIGRYSVANGTGFTGYLDEIRFSGIARWTESFTPPYKAYQDSTPALLTGGYTITGSGTIENGLIDSTDQWEGSTYINTLGTVLTGTLGTGTTFEGTLNSSTTFSGDAGQITAKAWVKYDQDPSTVNDSFNVSSVSDNATGEFTVNFATTMPSANYVTIGMSEDDRFMTIGNNVPPTSSAVKVQTTHYNGNRYDRDHNNVLVFGD